MKLSKWAVTLLVSAAVTANAGQAGSPAAAMPAGPIKSASKPLAIVEPPMPLPGKGLALIQA